MEGLGHLLRCAAYSKSKGVQRPGTELRHRWLPKDDARKDNNNVSELN
jgi:hypothetical protein